MNCSTSYRSRLAPILDPCARSDDSFSLEYSKLSNKVNEHVLIRKKGMKEATKEYCLTFWEKRDYGASVCAKTEKVTKSKKDR